MSSSSIAKMICILIVASLLFVKDGCAAKELPTLATVPKVDLARSMGVWYEIARFDHYFQKGCLGSSAAYTLLPDGEVEVINRCVSEKDNSQREVKGRAWSVDPDGNARLKVSFFWPFRTDYWIIDLGKDYEYVVVGAPSREYLWIMARKPVMQEAVYKNILDLVANQGFVTGRLVRKPLILKP